MGNESGKHQLFGNYGIAMQQKYLSNKLHYSGKAVNEVSGDSRSGPVGITELLVRRGGRKPFGYFEGEPETIAKMRSMREKGLGFDRIAAELNDQGVPTRSRKEWHGVVVNRILLRPYTDDALRTGNR
jgi:hypothetical protein